MCSIGVQHMYMAPLLYFSQHLVHLMHYFQLAQQCFLHSEERKIDKKKTEKVLLGQ